MQRQTIVDPRLTATAAVMSVIDTDNPNEPEGTWSAWDLHVRTGRPFEDVQRAIAHLRECGKITGRYVGGTSGHLWNLAEDQQPCWGVYELSYRELDAMPDLAEGQSDDLKIDGDRFRVWLARTGEDDGEPWDRRVSVEMFVAGSWLVVENWQAA